MSDAIVSIVYFTGAGHTARLAEAVMRGAASVSGVSTHLIPIRAEDISEGRYGNPGAMAALGSSDAIVFGSPTYMGGPAVQFKAFADSTVADWLKQAWRDKLAAGFTVSGALSGDKLSTLQYFHTLAMQHGMIWVGLGERPGQPDGLNRLGSWAGAMAQAANEDPDVAPSHEDKMTAERLGSRVGQLAAKMKEAGVGC